MARVRSSPREASRHSGRQYNTGRQYEFDDIQTTHLGPWQAVVSDPLDRTWQSSIVDIYPYWIKDGKLSPFLAGSGLVGTGSDAYRGLGSLPLLGANWQIYFTEDGSTGNLKITCDDGSTSTTADTGDVGNGGRVIWTSVGKRIYFIQQGVAKMYIFDVDDTTTSFTSTTTHASATKLTTLDECWFIYNLDNNLCIICQDATQVPTIYWYADSNITSTGRPGGFYASGTQPGAGNYLFKTNYGQVTGFGLFDNSVLVFGEYGCIRMSPTGTLPAFRFEEVPYITGMARLNAAVGGSSGVLYIGRDGKARVTQGGQAQIPGTQGPRWNPFSSTLYVSYLPGIDAWTVWDTTEGDEAGNCWVLSAGALEWVSVLTAGNFSNAQFIINTTNDAGTLGASTDADTLTMAWGTSLSLQEFAWTDTVYTLRDDIRTPYLSLGEEAHIQYIDIYVTDPTGTQIDINNVEIDVIRGGTVTNIVGTLVESNDYMQRWAFNALTRMFRVVLDVTSSGDTNEVAGIGGIDIVWKPASMIEKSRLRA